MTQEEFERRLSALPGVASDPHTVRAILMLATLWRYGILAPLQTDAQSLAERWETGLEAPQPVTRWTGTGPKITDLDLPEG